LESVASRTYVCGAWIGMAYASVGLKEKAIDWVRRSFEDREPSVAHVSVDPRFNSLRRELGFARIVEKIKLWTQFMMPTTRKDLPVETA
jgi:hypothetical protein